MSAQHSIIQLGLYLLKNGSIGPEELKPYSEAFGLLGVNVKIPLELKALQSVFLDSSKYASSNVRYYKLHELDPKEINYPSEDQRNVKERKGEE
jgi:hypothetical protein